MGKKKPGISEEPEITTVNPYSFPEFATRENAIAPIKAMIRALGATKEQQDTTEEERTNIQVEGIIKNASEEIFKALKELEKNQGEQAKITIQDILRANVATIIETSRNRAKTEHGSMLDVTTTGLTEENEIKKELVLHGIDITTKEGREKGLRIMKEAINFFTRIITPRTKEALSPALKRMRNLVDLYNVFKTGAGQTKHPKPRMQDVPAACALLRIACVINIIERDTLLSIAPEAYEEVEKQIRKYFVPTRTNEEHSVIFLPRTGSISPQIWQVNKRLKTRDSMIIKLLKKPQAHPRKIMDGIGLELLTKSKKDSLLLIYQMFFDPSTAIFTYTGIRIKHNKNLLITPEKLLEILRGAQSGEDLVSTIGNQSIFAEKQRAMSDSNEDSMEEYKDLIHLVADIHIALPSEKHITFPIEIQVKDVSRNGIIQKKAPHAIYKNDQIDRIIRRILRNNLYTKFLEYLEEAEGEEGRKKVRKKKVPVKKSRSSENPNKGRKKGNKKTRGGKKK